MEERCIMINTPYVSDTKPDDDIWIPPEPEDTKRYIDRKKEQEKAMMGAMNGKFKRIVRKLLRSESLEYWLDIVTCLCWEAALLIKPDCDAGVAMNPLSYLKVKCVASGARNHSQVVNGLVFTKNDVCDHIIPTNITHPRLLLFQGALTHSATGLSSLKYIGQEDGYKKLIIKMIENCRPDIILVEKAVSLDIQEYLLQKEIAFIFDVKISCLEKIARSTGSEIISSANVLARPMLKQCGVFHVEKFVAEHNNKSLVFTESFPKPLGCTILLKGANSDELRKVKHIIRSSVSVAYHLIHEIQFFVDQRTIFTDMNTASEVNSTSSKAVIDIPIDDEIQNIDTSNFSVPKSWKRVTNGKLLSSLSASLKNFLGKTKRFTSYFGHGSRSEKIKDETGSKSDQEEPGNVINDPQNDVEVDNHSDIVEMQSESIVVFLSKQYILKRTVCEPRHVSRMTNYGNSDKSLGRYLHDAFFNQKLSCEVCSEPAEAHEYCYAHKNGIITANVLNLPIPFTLSGENENMIWMWSRCLKCERENGISSTTQRVVMSLYSHGLSFGKFLELSLSSYYASTRLSICGHQLHRDCLRFFGLGSKVAMFKYTPIEIYDMCKTQVPQSLDPSKQDLFVREVRDILSTGDFFFKEVGNILNNCSKNNDILNKARKMLIDDRLEFEASLVKAINDQVLQKQYPILELNWLSEELLLLLYIWDCRLHFISSSTGKSLDQVAWAPFSELRKELKSDLNYGLFQKFEVIKTYTPSYLSPIQELLSAVASSLHFQVGNSDNIISVLEDEMSSIIACSLALSKETTTNEVIDIPIYETVAASSHWSVTGFLESELFMDRAIRTGNLHQVLPVGFKYHVISIYGKQFHSLRERCCVSETDYISSLRRCKKWDARGGKSKAMFSKTMDDRFILKQINKPELHSFLKFGLNYFKHVNECLDSGSQSCLAKIFGLYQVRQCKGGKEIRTDVVVMENLFFGRNILCKYDLKGAVFSRYVKNSDDSETVLLDENFVEDTRISPVHVGQRTKHLLERAIWNDTAFLTANNVMDYSLLVGIDRQKHEIIFGIIDYLRQYSWDKHLETWVKAHLVVPKNELPTVISPKDYKRRLRKFMTKYFLTVTDT